MSTLESKQLSTKSLLADTEWLDCDQFAAICSNIKERFAVIFDLDGTLVDTSKSYDETVLSLVLNNGGKAYTQHDLKKLREEGGFNDDWQASQELLRRSGIDIPLEMIAETGKHLYLSLAAKVETLMIQYELLNKLGQIYPLFIVTGRPRLEYSPVWGERLDPYFKKIYCLDDIPGKRSKPSPDYFHVLMEEHALETGVYIGNSVDDMHAAKAAQLYRIGLTWDHSEEVLKKAGAQITISTLNQLERLFRL